MTRRAAALAAAVLAAAAFAACAAKSPSLTGGTYTMAAEGESAEEAAFSPSVCFDVNSDTFTFGYNPLSSYLSMGSITVSGGKVTAKTDDGLYTYVFELVDEDTVRFLADGSSETVGADGNTAVPDGAEFRRTENAEP